MTRVYTLQEIKELWRQNQQKGKELMSMFQNQFHITTAPDYFEHVVSQFATNTCIEDIGALSSSSPCPRVLTYEQVNREANKVAHWALEVLHLKPHDVVALYMENCAEFIIFWIGLSKIGCVIACINTYITGKQISHAIELAETRHLIMSSNRMNGWKSCIGCFESSEYLNNLNVWIFDRSDPMASIEQEELGQTNLNCCKQTTMINRDIFARFSDNNPDKSIRSSISSEDPLFYIYTSGTTGKSKAALFSHRRVIGAGVSWSIAAELTEKDRYYVCLPLYHGNGGVVAVSAIFRVGCTMVLREKFSATQFLNDIRQYRCTAMIYIGELWRYIHNQPETPYDKDNNLRVIIGNGLRPDIWTQIVQRFNIEKVVEHYGQTEMIAAHPMMNCYNVVGSCGYIPYEEVWSKQYEEKLVKYNIENDTVYRNKDGFCEEAAIDEPGEDLVYLPNGMYKAYTSAEANEKKVYRDVFKKGDMWFRSGDLLKVNKDGFFFFVDRVGDSFRWKGENVSTNEVSEALTKFKGIREAIVYGVSIPGTEGKAGMAILQIDEHESLNLTDLLSYLHKELASYAIPLFLRIRTQESSKTSTLKVQKFEYQKEAFHLDLVPSTDIIYFLAKDSPTYIPLTQKEYDAIMNQKVRF